MLGLCILKPMAIKVAMSCNSCQLPVQHLLDTAAENARCYGVFVQILLIQLADDYAENLGLLDADIPSEALEQYAHTPTVHVGLCLHALRSAAWPFRTFWVGD